MCTKSSLAFHLFPFLAPPLFLYSSTGLLFFGSILPLAEIPAEDPAALPPITPLV